MAWIPIPGTKYFSEDGKGVYEKLGGKTSDGLYLRISPLDESEELDFSTLAITLLPFVIPRSQTERNKRYTYRR